MYCMWVDLKLLDYVSSYPVLNLLILGYFRNCLQDLFFINLAVMKLQVMVI